MKYMCFKKGLLLLILSISSLELVARHYDTVDSCASSLCDCFNLQVHAGIAPVIWANRGAFSIITCNANQGCPDGTLGNVIPVFTTPKFNKFYKLPWTVGGKIGYMISDCTEVYVEGNYRQASSKHNVLFQESIVLPLSTIRPTFLFNSFSKYKLFDFYVGSRYYFDFDWCGCDPVTIFVGLQVGFAHRKAIATNLTVSSLTNTCSTFNTSNLLVLPKYTAFAGGANLGFEYCWCNCLTLVFTAEFLATGNCRRAITNFTGCIADAVLPELRPQAFIFGGPATEIFFPITLGLKYSF